MYIRGSLSDVQMRCNTIKRSLVVCFFLTLLASSVCCNEESRHEFYGIEAGDSLAYVTAQVEKYGFTRREENIWTESGEEVALYLSKADRVSVIVVVSEQKVHWVDVVEFGATIDRVVVGSLLSQYITEDEPLYRFGHRESSLDELVIRVNSVLALVDGTTQHINAMTRYEETHDIRYLDKIIIKGIWLR